MGILDVLFRHSHPVPVHTHPDPPKRLRAAGTVRGNRLVTPYRAGNLIRRNTGTYVVDFVEALDPDDHIILVTPINGNVTFRAGFIGKTGFVTVFADPTTGEGRDQDFYFGVFSLLG